MSIKSVIQVIIRDNQTLKVILNVNNSYLMVSRIAALNFLNWINQILKRRHCF